MRSGKKPGRSASRAFTGMWMSSTVSEVYATALSTTLTVCFRSDSSTKSRKGLKFGSVGSRRKASTPGRTISRRTLTWRPESRPSEAAALGSLSRGHTTPFGIWRSVIPGGFATILYCCVVFCCFILDTA
eukprot:612927-Pyramimonas_sp.AAC.1